MDSCTLEGSKNYFQYLSSITNQVGKFDGGISNRIYKSVSNTSTLNLKITVTGKKEVNNEIKFRSIKL